jgi:hypothetical protein
MGRETLILMPPPFLIINLLIKKQNLVALEVVLIKKIRKN